MNGQKFKLMLKSISPQTFYHPKGGKSNKQQGVLAETISVQ